MDTNTIIAADVSVLLIDPADPLTGVAVYEWLVDLGNQYSDSFAIGITVDGYYSCPQEQTVITVSKPLQDFITGGGYLINENSAGTYAGDPDLKTNFGFNVKFNKTLTNLQGKVNAIIRKDGSVYQIKTNATESLVVNPLTDEATFVSKANLTDVTDPLNPISISGNLSLYVDLTDNGEPGSSDSIAFTLWKNNELWFSSNWTGAQTEEQVLAGGNLVVRAGETIQAAGGAIDDQSDGEVLTLEQLNPIVDEAISRWAESGIGSEQISVLEDVEFRVADLGGSTIGLAFDNTVWIDVDAAGHGWFVDDTQYQDAEFMPQGKDSELVAYESSAAYGDLDLLTVVMHELGHVLGYEDLDPADNLDDLMSATLDPGERHVPGDGEAGLVVMDSGAETSSAEAAVPASMEHAKTSWLIDFLVQSAKGQYNPFDPKDDIRIVLMEDDEDSE